ncbi:MAG: hypothetical protein ACXW2C_10150 [Acidimicrobiia bacterium]
MSAESLSDRDWMGFHELRLRGVIVLTDDPEQIELAVVLERVGFATRRGPRLVPTPVGRDAHATWSRLEPGSDAAAAAERAYAGFLPLNRELLRLCHDWQVRGGAANTHDDRAYDWSVIGRLVELDERVGPVVRRLARAVPRFESYRPALRGARSRVEDGESEWFASPRCDSYHTVWMRLHEDLLCATGAERNAEPPVE